MRRSDRQVDGSEASGEIFSLARGVTRAAVDGVVVATEVARDILARTPREDLRHALLDIPGTMIDTFLREVEGGRGEARERPRSAGPDRPARPTSSPDGAILRQARTYLNRVPQRVATLGSLIDHLRATTDQDEETIRSAVRRNFVTRGDLVFDRNPPDVAPAVDLALMRMRNTLRELGYDDLRSNVEATDIAGIDLRAELVAYEAGVPVVVCYPTTQHVSDVYVREAARVLASAIDRDHRAKYVWVSDGVSDHVLDVEEDRALSSVPGAAR